MPIDTPQHAVRDGQYRIIYVVGNRALYKMYVDVKGAIHPMLNVGGDEQGHMVGYAGFGTKPAPVAEVLLPTVGANPGGVWHYQPGLGWALKNNGLPVGIYWQWLATNPYNPGEWLLRGNTATHTKYQQPTSAPIATGGGLVMWGSFNAPLWHTTDFGETWYPIYVPYVKPFGQTWVHTPSIVEVGFSLATPGKWWALGGPAGFFEGRLNGTVWFGTGHTGQIIELHNSGDPTHAKWGQVFHGCATPNGRLFISEDDAPGSATGYRFTSVHEDDATLAIGAGDYFLAGGMFDRRRHPTKVEFLGSDNEGLLWYYPAQEVFGGSRGPFKPAEPPDPNDPYDYQDNRFRGRYPAYLGDVPYFVSADGRSIMRIDLTRTGTLEDGWDNPQFTTAYAVTGRAGFMRSDTQTGTVLAARRVGTGSDARNVFVFDGVAWGELIGPEQEAPENIANHLAIIVRS